MKKKIVVEKEVLPFLVPNFVLCGEDKEPVHISKFNDEELRELGLQFTEELIKKSKRPLTP